MTRNVLVFKASTTYVLLEILHSILFVAYLEQAPYSYNCYPKVNSVSGK